MPSSLKVKTQIIEKVFGPEITPKIIKKINDEGEYLILKKSDASLRLLIHPIADYIDNFCNGDYSILEKHTISEIHKLYGNSVHELKLSLSPINYKEHNKIILDYRIDNIGFYWIDYEKCYSMEMTIRMDNCGRINYGDTLLELRETVLENGIISNYSRVYVAYNEYTGTIFQIKGMSNKMPNANHFDYIFKLFMESDLNFVEYKPQFEPHNDFRVSDLTKIQQCILKEKIPKLFTNSEKLI